MTQNLMPESHLKDHDLISNALQGDSDALDTLFSRNRGLLHSLAYRILRNHEESEDAVQNCLLQAFRNLEAFEYQGVFQAWLVRILINEALSILRKKKSRPTIVSESTPSEDKGEWLEQFPSLGPNPEQALAKRESVAALRRNLIRLSTPLRSAILLCDVSEHTLEEAGVVLGVAPSTVKMRRFRARRSLQQKMLVRRAECI